MNWTSEDITVQAVHSSPVAYPVPGRDVETRIEVSCGVIDINLTQHVSELTDRAALAITTVLPAYNCESTTDKTAAGLYPVLEQTGATQSLTLCFRRACLVNSVAKIIDRSPQAEERRLWLVIVTKEVTMNVTFRAFLYGLLILTAALIPPTIFLVNLIGNLAGS